VICVEVIYACPQHSLSKSLRLEHGATLAEALTAVAAEPGFSGVDLEKSTVGIFGKPMGRDTKLGDGDRIEIYRPLMEEPKLARRKRADRRASKPFRS
jgi:putative ubiquitin-RnfH superfamily antitoxin RatB of RatAB toxin-antitoxin module